MTVWLTVSMDQLEEDASPTDVAQRVSDALNAAFPYNDSTVEVDICE